MRKNRILTPTIPHDQECTSLRAGFRLRNGIIGMWREPNRSEKAGTTYQDLGMSSVFYES